MLKLPIEDQRIDLWYVFSESISDPALLDEYRSWLPREEVEQERRFVFEKSRLQFLVTRILIRAVLSHYTDDELDVWRFARNAYGKPSLEAPAGLPLEFNLSHTDGLVVCAVSLGHELGVDTEDLKRASDHLALARRYFAPAEVAALETLAPQEQGEAFLQFWTLKEAFIKARGMGLSIPLDSFAFSVGKDRPPTVSFATETPEVPEDWQFAQLRLADRYQVALAARFPASEELTLQVRRTVPLRWQGDGQVLPPTPSREWIL